MSVVDLIMPKMGESIMEATVLKWHKNPGDSVKMDETVLEIATDKVDSEVPSTAAGTIVEILFKENDVVPIGTVIARIDTGNGTAAAAPQAAAAPAAAPAPVAVQAAPAPQVSAAPAGVTGGNRFYSPLVLNIAAKEGIGMAELENIPGTGNEGRVTKKRYPDLCCEQRRCSCTSCTGSCRCATSCSCSCSGCCCTCCGKQPWW